MCYSWGVWTVLKLRSVLTEVLSRACAGTFLVIYKFNVGLKSFLRNGLSEPEFYGDLVYKFKNIVGRTDFSDQLR